MQPVFAFGEGIIWRGNESEPWIQLGVNVVSMLSIVLWAGVHSMALFGGLYYFGLLRVDAETELRGCDMTKHGEDAYPEDPRRNVNFFDASTQTPAYLNNQKEGVNENGTNNTVYQRKRITPNKLDDGDMDCMDMENLRTILNICKAELDI